MKKLTVVLLWMVTLVACKKEETNRSACDDPKFSRTNPMMNFKGQILPEIQQGKATGDYVIQYDEASKLKPCNLPQAYRVDSLRVTVSGYFLSSEDMPYINLSSLPFEITQIQKQ